MEVELKLLVTAAGAAALRAHPLLQQYAHAKPREQTLSGTYFDTPQLDIRRCDAGLRVRRVDDDWVQTLKAGGSVDGGLHSRNEWESPVTGPAPDLAVLRGLVGHKTAWSNLLRSTALDHHLTPVFTTEVRRTVWNLLLPQGDEVECVLDLGQLVRGAQRVPISEIELELKHGDPAHLFDFALALSQAIPMRIGNLSKSDRGYALFAPQAPAAVKATRLKLSKRMNVEQAFQAIVANCMAQIQANEIGVVQAHDVESLHQMRVGLRRLRSALGLFKDFLILPPQLQQEIDWFNTALGAPRDWDVLAGSTLPAIAGRLPEDARVAAVSLCAVDRAHALHGVVAGAVESPRYTRLILAFTRWTQSCAWRETMTKRQQKLLRQDFPGVAQQMLIEGRERLEKRGSRLQDASTTDRHRTRIAAKKVRYATEFFRSLYPKKIVQSYLKGLSGLQDALGCINDRSVADRLLLELSQTQPDLAGSTAFIRGYLCADGLRDTGKVVGRWERFARLAAPA